MNFHLLNWFRWEIRHTNYSYSFSSYCTKCNQSTVFLEKPAVDKVVKDLPAFYETRSFIIVSTNLATGLYLEINSVNIIHTLFKINFSSILPSTSKSPKLSLSFSFMRATCATNLTLLDFTIVIFFFKVKTLKLFFR
jgi:hypothetical protein